VREEDLPKRYRPLLRRLQKAVADPMDAEDELIEEFKDYQRLISEKEKTISEKERQIESAILKLHAAGTDIEELASIFGLTVEEVEKVCSGQWQ
jgi:predicted  nucleic acid-binding Zn-ribbon protein